MARAGDGRIPDHYRPHRQPARVLPRAGRGAESATASGYATHCRRAGPGAGSLDSLVDLASGRGPVVPIRPESSEDGSGHQQQAGLPDSDLYLNPYTGEELGRRSWGDITQGRVNLMAFIYRLHFALALGTIGSYTLGIIALLWTLDASLAPT